MSECKLCDEPLILCVGGDDEDGSSSGPLETVPDDVELRCRCHFHWYALVGDALAAADLHARECLMDQASSVALSLRCPSCHSYLPDHEASTPPNNPFFEMPSNAPILARYSNEGGVQDDLDIFPSIAEEAYVNNNPEVRPARAFHILCADGDAAGIVDLLRNVSPDFGDMGPLVRYQDPLAENKTALHLAVESGRFHIVWLLLWLSSTVPTECFPLPSRQGAESMGLGRLSVQADADVRGLRDAHGRTAEDIAQQNQALWAPFIQAGVLKP